MQIKDYIAAHRERVEGVLDRQLRQRRPADARLVEAMRYGVFNGGKRLRPVLAYAGAHALGGDAVRADIPACALELVHSYSLIHDDLPSMDDDALRRGKPTCHIAFDEATAILAGDALQALAFELLAASPLLAVGDRVRLKMLALLGGAAGWRGMVAGQSLDIGASGHLLDEPALAGMHRLKTGALIRASVLLGALSTGMADRDVLERLGRYAECVGLAFQVTDDILDVCSDTGTLGKEQGRDQVLNKPTYVSLLGLEGARDRARQLCEQALEAVAGPGLAAEPLRQLAAYIVQRDH